MDAGIPGMTAKLNGIEPGGGSFRRNPSLVSPQVVLTYVNAYDFALNNPDNAPMNTLSASEARARLYRLIDEAAASHEPVLIAGKRNSAVLVSGEDWSAIQETLFLLSVPGMRESILEGLSTPVEECGTELAW